MITQLEWPSLSPIKVARVNSAISKLDRKEIIKLLMAVKLIKKIGSLEVVNAFADDIEHLITNDQIFSVARKISDPQQRKKFTLILKHADALLRVLKPLKRYVYKRENADDLYICDDVHTSTLMMISGCTLNETLLYENGFSSSVGQSERGCSETLINGCADYRYPHQVIRHLEILRNVVEHARAIIKPKGGNDPNRDSKTMRKTALANDFVSSYKRRFGGVPPLTVEGPVHQVFIKLLQAVDLAPENEGTSKKNIKLGASDNFSALRNAIKEAGGRGAR